MQPIYHYTIDYTISTLVEANLIFHLVWCEQKLMFTYFRKLYPTFVTSQLFSLPSSIYHNLTTVTCVHSDKGGSLLRLLLPLRKLHRLALINLVLVSSVLFIKHTLC